MDYGTIVNNEFIPRCQAALNSMRDTLITAGLAANRVSVSMPDTTDLRFQLTATRGGNTITCYIELTDGTHLGQAGGQAVFTFWIDRNGVEVTTTYTPGQIRSYQDDAGLQALLGKLSDLELTIPEAAV